MKCKCGKGYASEVDGRCKYCREGMHSRALCKSVGVRHRGDGLSLDQYYKIPEWRRV
ncbi:hypothetical protein vBAspATola_31 [Aeromonas phage vB_AspA_Tola]|nr:hypothetical protein vBAspATola_31 [Aeromonas phage vB_AspA_Tola]